jgi:hypothetical protein
MHRADAGGRHRALCGFTPTGSDHRSVMRGACAAQVLRSGADQQGAARNRGDRAHQCVVSRSSARSTDQRRLSAGAQARVQRGQPTASGFAGDLAAASTGASSPPTTKSPRRYSIASSVGPLDRAYSPRLRRNPHLIGVSSDTVLTPPCGTSQPSVVSAPARVDRPVRRCAPQ